MRIFIIGSGNVATQLGNALLKACHAITGVYSRHFSHARKLAGKLDSKAIEIPTVPPDTDIILIAVTDDSIPEIIQKIKAGKQIIVHTSGGVDINVFKRKFKNYGVFYPVQTIKSNQKINFKNVPLCIEANNETSQKKLLQLAGSISEKIFVLNSQQRRYLHLAAVFANNFSNHLFTIAEKIVTDQNLPYEILALLIKTTADNATKGSPDLYQTGPAKRGDKKVMQKHLKLLKRNVEWKRIYEVMSSSIKNSGK